MKSNRVLLATVVFAVICFGMIAATSADGIAVGSSTLIGTLDYSDTFTTAANGGLTGRSDAGWPPVNPASTACQVENTYGNPAQSWTYEDWGSDTGMPIFGNFVTDSTVSGNGRYPGSSNAGSATGFTQSGSPGGLDFGIAYNLRNTFVVQFDAVMPSDRVDISTSNAANTVGGGNGLSVFFRSAGAGGPQIGLFSSGNGLGETDTGLLSGLSSSAYSTWHNFAVKFDLTAGLIDVYTDQVLRGQVNLHTFDGGAYWNVVNASTNDYVSVGQYVNDRAWTDNFQVGSSVPEPTSLVLLVTGLLGLLAYAWRKRK